MADQLLSELVAESVRDWLGQGVTKLFFSYVDTLRRDNETNVFAALVKNSVIEAASNNAAREENMGIMLIPDRIVTDMETLREAKKIEKESKSET